MAKIYVFIYYFIIRKLPDSKYLSFSNKVRCWYLHKVLNILSGTESTKVESNVYLGNLKNVKIGEGSRINENVFIQGAYIGKNVLVAPSVAILSKNHEHGRVDIPIVDQGETEAAPPIIGDGAWIGRNAVVLPGVKIGEGAIVGACSFVNRDVEPFAVVGGVPARFIKSRIPDNAEVERK